MGFIRNFLDKIAEYLPDDEPMTEQEKVYEESKQRIYEMHQKEKDIFYAEQAWIEGSKAKIYGEVAGGYFRKGDTVTCLDVEGKVLLDGEILAVEMLSEERQEDEWEEKRVYLIFEREKISEKEDFFVQTYYVIKKR